MDFTQEPSEARRDAWPVFWPGEEGFYAWVCRPFCADGKGGKIGLFLGFPRRGLVFSARPMSVLFAIAILSCCALVWAAVQIARHVRKAGRDEVTPPRAETTRRPAARVSKEAPETSAGLPYADLPYADPPVGGRRPGSSRQVKATQPTREDWKYDGRGLRGTEPVTERKQS